MNAVKIALASSALLLSSGIASAQSGANWDKTYSVSGHPTLQLNVSDSNLTIHSCSNCQTVRIHVTAKNENLSRYKLEESQSGDIVHFSLVEKPSIGFHTSWHSSAVQVDVETPSTLTLEAKASDGNIIASGLQGDLTIHTSDGNVEMTDLQGNLKLHSSDGHLHVNNFNGALEATTSDGNLDASGSFNSLQVRSSDGSIKLELAQGSRLNAESRIETHDGSVALRLPTSFAAEFDVHANDGSIESSLPLVIEGFNSKGNSGHNIHGKLNGGGSLLTIHTSDGSIRLSTL